MIETIGEAKAFEPVRPWVRYWARGFDTVIYATLANLLFFPLTLLNVPTLGLPLEYIHFAAWTLIEAYFLSSLGTTPGKWLFKISLQRKDNQKLTYKESLIRSLRVWYRGNGLYILFIPIITNIIAYKRLEENGITSWDKDGELVITHQHIGVTRIIGIIGLSFLLPIIAGIIIAIFHSISS